MNGWDEGQPAWWLNLEAHPDAVVRLAHQQPCLVRARRGAGEERDRLWQRWVAVDPKLDAYAGRRSTETPVVVYKPRNGPLDTGGNDVRPRPGDEVIVEGTAASWTSQCSAPAELSPTAGRVAPSRSVGVGRNSQGRSTPQGWVSCRRRSPAAVRASPLGKLRSDERERAGAAREAGQRPVGRTGRRGAWMPRRPSAVAPRGDRAATSTTMRSSGSTAMSTAAVPRSAIWWAAAPVSCTSVSPASASTVGRLANGVCEQSTSGLLHSLNRGVDASSEAIGKVDAEVFPPTVLTDPLTLFIGCCEMQPESGAARPRRPGEHGR
jgi:F420H(2)-dependent quinone reductase